MKKRLAIITPTYNRVRLLKRLYDSLMLQSDHDFAWIVVNDGSMDSTSEMMRELLERDHPFEILYIEKTNGGKGSATNAAFDHAKDFIFVLIVDDDEELYPNAVSIVLEYVDKYRQTDCGGIEFLRDGKDGKPIANYKKDDFFMSLPKRRKKRLYIDGYTGYFVDKLGDKRFPVIKDETYISTGIVQLMVSNEAKLLWPDKSIGTTEYLEGGLTRQGRKMRLKNPKGMIIHCIMHMQKDYPLWCHLGYSVMGFAYLFYADLKEEEIKAEGIEFYRLKKICKFPGLLLSEYWKMKYKTCT